MKKRSIILIGLIAIFLNSCVYSLFPIYTEDTLVFKEELLGTWDLGDDSFMIFERGSEEEEKKEDEDKEYKYSIDIKEGFTISSDEPISMEIDGKTVYDEDVIRKEMLRRMSQSEPVLQDTAESEASKKLFEKASSVAKKGNLEYEGSVAVFEDKSYRLTVVEEDKDSETAYVAHLVDIGGDLFLDLYPITNYNSKDFSDNYFPVHTFYKVEVTKDHFTMIHFDLDKLNDLFESNLIRLRHENVDGTILITAQPKELQKFFDKYADDESVFSGRETYSRSSL
ncbi:hypothetical protein [Ekhidna sp.]|uniref:hypothetical protein n=1 Tax=Ekhidna sp. TaxID=2608089 RepID=UPI003297AD2D